MLVLDRGESFKSGGRDWSLLTDDGGDDLFRKVLREAVADAKIGHWMEGGN